MSTPTPRTDKMSESLLSKTFLTSYVTMQELARTLERELATERAKVRVLRSALEKLYADTIYHHDYVDEALEATEDKP